MKKVSILVLGGLSCFSLHALAADRINSALEETLVSASRTETSAREVGSSVTVIDASDIEARGFVSIQDILRTLPSVSVSNAGGVGKQSGLRIRGEEAYRTLILVDGVDYSDPTTTQPLTHIEHLLTTDIERVEVLRGPQGMMYGADAGGVINIITRKGNGSPQGSVQSETGRYGSERYSSSLRGKVGILDYSASANHVHTAGFNAQTADIALEDKDGYSNITYDLNLGMQLNDNFRVETSGRKIDASSEFDGCGFPTVHDCEASYRQESYKIGLVYSDEKFTQRFSHHHQDLIRKNYASGSLSYLTEGGLDGVQYFGSLEVLPWLKAIWGVDRQREFIDSNDPSDIRKEMASYAEAQINVNDTWFMTIGSRYDDNEDFGHFWSQRFTTAYLWDIDKTTLKLRGSYGDGFRAPSLFEDAYNSSPWASAPASDIQLKEETSQGYDLGVDIINEGGASFSIGYFEQTIEDAIEFDLVSYSGYLQDSGNSESWGWEVGSHWPIEPRTTLIMNYTYNHTEDSDGDQRLRRPERVTNLGIDHRIPAINLTMFMNYRFVRDAVDVGLVDLPDYQVLDMSLNWQASEQLSFYVRGENITGARYQEVTGYNVAGASTYVGARFSF